MSDQCPVKSGKENNSLNGTTTSLSLATAITIPSRGFSKAFLSSESCRISDSVALSSGFLLSIHRSSLFVNSYSCTGVQTYWPSWSLCIIHWLLVMMHTNLGNVIFYELLYLLCSNTVCGCLGNIVTHMAGELLWRDTYYTHALSSNLIIICHSIATPIILSIWG